MILYIVRHAIAVPHGTPGVAEDDRPLTPEGIEKMERGALGLRRLGVKPDAILSSPLARARHTAEIVKEAIGRKIPLELVAALTPYGRRPELYQKLLEFGDADELMLVGHQPSLGEIAGEIAWGDASNYVELKKGGACAIEMERIQPSPRGSLQWLVTPALLRNLQ